MEFLYIIISQLIIAGLENFLVFFLRTHVKVSGLASGRDHLLNIVCSHPLFGDKFEKVIVRAKV